MNRLEFYLQCKNHDWFYEMSDDHSVWKAGSAAETRLRAEDPNNKEGKQAIYSAFCAARSEAFSAGKAGEWPTFHELTGNHIAYLIDPAARTITPVEYDGNYKSIYELIGATTFDVVRVENDDCIFVDDEGLINGNGQRNGFWTYGEYPQPLAGKGLVLGTDEEGESVSAKNTHFDYRRKIGWVDMIMNNQIVGMNNLEWEKNLEQQAKDAPSH